MSFRWDQRMPDEWPAVKPISGWVRLLLYLIVEIVAVAIVLSGWQKGVSLLSGKFFHDVFLVPFPAWLALCFVVYMVAYDGPAMEAARHNRKRYFQATRWQREVRSGVAVLDSVVLAPEPDLAVRMLGLEGKALDNPGKVMAIDVTGTTDTPRLQCVLTQLLTPLLPRLAKAIRTDSFDIVTQAEGVELAAQVHEVWKQLELPRTPRVRSLDIGTDPGFAACWFEDDIQPAYPYASYNVDRTPKYRLLLTWHLNSEGQEGEQAFSEAAVALLLGSPALMAEEKPPKQQAWLLREITGGADEVDRSLSLLLDAGQVPRERIHHFWHSRLKGIAQHGTMGAVRESGLKLDGHDLEQAVGPQARVSRWLLQALAAKMAHFGQGPQLIALPHEQGVALNLVAKVPAPMDVPWKKEYGYDPVVGPESGAFASLWAFAMFVSPNKDWGTFETTFSAAIVACLIGCFVFRNPEVVKAAGEGVMDFVASMTGF
ncbi:hypothetical protein [Paraburkholderia acidipaludis]|uniref:hypothetical protein n=1 Tax=Paraburkholderia acidipaludis TaxID=660537 RepID=UPI0005B78DB4|nr:hypothetical protein [Paraburkholderia acidipaludis]